MNEEQLRANMRITQSDLPAPVTQRLDWLEADGAAQRTAILKLERACKLLLKIVWVLWFMCAMLAWVVLS